MRGMQQALMDRLSFCKKITEACVLDKARHAVVKRLVGRLQNEAKEKFWRVVVAATTYP